VATLFPGGGASYDPPVLSRSARSFVRRVVYFGSTDGNLYAIE